MQSEINGKYLLGTLHAGFKGLAQLHWDRTGRAGKNQAAGFVLVARKLGH